jgi:hypothetical protein
MALSRRFWQKKTRFDRNLTSSTETMAAAFPKIPKIRYEGPDSRNPLSFKHYNAEEARQ